VAAAREGYHDFDKMRKDNTGARMDEEVPKATAKKIKQA